MSTTTETPEAAAPKGPQTNRLGLELSAYRGGESTLCAGCGHDSITKSIIDTFFQLGVEPWRLAKMSGIGCSSKTTAYFLSQSHGFNAVHGRMAAIASGVNVANHSLINVGVSGDGDTASIGLGNFLHMVRRNVPMVYIIENNGCYGLTKGQFSATADRGSVQKGGDVNQMEPLDMCAMAIQVGCSYVARSFSGDFKQVLALMKGAVAHGGTAVIDIVSPCITFNNHEGSTKSYKYAKSHEDPLHDLGFMAYFEEIKADYDPGTEQLVTMHDGSKILLKKLTHDYDPSNKMEALKLLSRDQAATEFFTGLLYYNPNHVPADQQMNIVDAPLATLPSDRIRPKPETLATILERYK